ncbi:N-acetyldiaminopimelate deacetylase [Oceanobacillus limi]|uniref:N-acetyldiaminopimelate deacetylase n=1 Tax=Oceanobacillus limi TaxID=930131 RepID=A0A1I0DBE0_9BACI|nr:N-acetyldiaminopimelate deacetylase [Oceanobacillus limi]SET28885.1 N-acetyldiaminopimelate deacetylase [Oceanobacillus limi]
MTIANLQNIRRELHRIPELGFQEYKTQAYLIKQINLIANDRTLIQEWKTGILVKIKGTNPSKTIGYRCDIDGLPITEDTGFSFRSSHEGRMHACGHDFHMTIALGSLQRIIEEPIQDDVVFIFQPAEEGPGGALPMMQSEEFNTWRPDCIFALHIAPELPVGTVSSKSGLLFANTSELFLDFVGKGGHAAYPHLTKDMSVAAGAFISQIQEIISRGIDPLDSAVLTIGKMESGHVQNAIAETARLEGTIRTLRPDTIHVVKRRLESIIRGFEINYDCSIGIDYGANYYQVYNEKNYVDLFKKAMKDEGLSYHEANKAMTGEDFGYMLKEIPGFMFWLGVESPFGLHHNKLQPNEDALTIGVRAVTKMIHELSSKNDDME